MSRVTCPSCQKVCKSQSGLQQHYNASIICKQTRRQFELIDLGLQKEPAKRPLDPEDDSSTSTLGDDVAHLPRKKRNLQQKLQVVLGEDSLARDKLTGMPEKNAQMDAVEGGYTNEEMQHQEEPEHWFDPYADDTSEEERNNNDLGQEYQALLEEEQEEVAAEPSNDCNRAFKAYVRNAWQNFGELKKREETAIKIMHKLLKKKATLDTYDAVMEWHLRECGKLGPRDSLGQSPHFISREKLLKRLRIRYNMVDKYAAKKRVLLPHSHVKLDVFWHHARDCVHSLLTDPRWKDEDWLYFDDDPFAPPPDNLDYIGDVNTGEAYLKTYKELITKPNQILVGIPLYIDGAVTGQFDKLQVTALKMSLCILNRRARDREHAWRSLGFVTNYTKEDARGKRIFVESGHVAAHELYMDSDTEEEGDNAGVEDDTDKAADYHAILSTLLESLFELIDEGMSVDIFYKGQLHKNCELVFFVPFVKCDGDEGDKLCCSYRSRGKAVSQLCRYCTCPNKDTDDPQARHPYKTEPMMQKLFEAKDAEKLKKLSQVCIENAFHGLRFGLHNNRGIHGACPWELLHAILLGIFKYARDCFFAQMGPSSATAAEINSLAKMIGVLLTRQSDRNKPRTQFAKGINKGKLMAKEFTGVMLVMAAILRMKAGQDMLKGATKKNFREDWLIRDWILLVETLLQWEAYLNLDQMEKKHVQRLKKKNRFVMFLLKKVGNRVKGMGFRVMKFHAIIHLAYDILMFGVPMVVDTGSNESHHKTTKVAAKLTQKDIKTFEKQTSDRCDDFLLLDIAVEEIDGRPLWSYFDGYEHAEPTTKSEETFTGGMRFRVMWDEETDEATFEIITRMKKKEEVGMDAALLNFLFHLQDTLQDKGVDEIGMCCEHSRGGQIFRAHPKYRGKGAWRDWVMIQWEEGEYPAQIWCFLEVMDIPEGVVLEDLHEDVSLEVGVYAVVESADYIDEGDQPQSDIFTPLMLETKEISADGEVAKRKFYVVDVETFKEPIVVIPDIGAKPACQYLLMKPRKNWSDDFIAWLEMPHQHDQIEMLPPPEDDDDVDDA